MKKKSFYFILLIMLLGCVGCAKETSTNDNLDYLLCNATSDRRMVEMENGYYYVWNNFLYYSDKADLGTWVPVCNQANCMHNSWRTCNAFIDNSSIVSKNGKIYTVNRDGDSRGPYIIEIALDGSGSKKVYDIPCGGENFINGGMNMLSQDKFILYYDYLGEDGLYHYEFGNLLEDGSVKILYQTTSEKELVSYCFLSSAYHIRGDVTIISTLLSETYDENLIYHKLWRMDGDEPEEVMIPESINIEGGHLSGDYFTYFEKGEGFYRIHLKTGEKTFLTENQLEDSNGYVLTEQFMIECNNYETVSPNTQVKFYNGTKWLDVIISEEVQNSFDKIGYGIMPLAIASDKIFMKQNVFDTGNLSGVEKSNLYYFDFNSDTPTLTYCNYVSQYSEEELQENLKEQETSENETAGEESEFEPITVVDNEDLLYQITSLEPDYENGFRVNMKWEFKSGSESNYAILPLYASINGLQCNIAAGNYIMATDKKGKDDIVFNVASERLKAYEIQNIYSPHEYTKIEITFLVKNQTEDDAPVEEKTVTIYPHGSKMAIDYERESQATDQILVDNEYITIILCGYEDGIIPNGEVKLYYINKTDKRIEIFMDNAFLNGYELESISHSDYVYRVYVNGDCSAYHTFSLSDMADSIGKNNITEITELKLPIRVYEPSDWLGVGKGEDFVNETFILNP